MIKYRPITYAPLQTNEGMTTLTPTYCPKCLANLYDIAKPKQCARCRVWLDWAQVEVVALKAIENYYHMNRAFLEKIAYDFNAGWSLQ